MRKVILYEPSIGSNNIGDQIIVDGVKTALKSYLSNAFIIELPTHTPLSRRYLKYIGNVDMKIVCGSNLIVGRLNTILHLRQWFVGMNFGNIGPLVFMGVGSQQYNQKISLFTKFAYNKMIMKEFIHSVRDEYTKSTLKDIGIQNVVNTACPSMWGLTKEHCSKIPINKSNICVFTLTDYKQKIERDNKLIAVLSKNYEHIYFWPQGFNDWQYFNKLKNIKNVKLISPNLKSYDDFLENTETDFIGTRLHGGIRALQKGKRTLIIGIDNRALELHKDFNIPVIIEENIINLESTICSRIIPSIRIPIENIKTFLNQFNIQN